MTTPTAEQSIDVAVPARVAYERWADMENYPIFVAGVKQVERTEHGTTRWTVILNGVRGEFEVEVVEQVPDERITWTATEGPYQRGTLTVEPLDDTNSRVTLALTYRPEPFIGKIGDIVGMARRRMDVDLRSFRAFAEAQHPAA